MLTFKKLSSFLLSVVMICSLCASGFAFGVFATETTESEEKVYCEATLADDFSDSRVLVVVDSLTSWKLEDFSLSDFAEVDCTAVKNLTALTQECLREKFEFVRASAERLRNGEILFPESFEGIDINPNTFKQILCLELNTPGKENVLKAIKALEKLPFVHYAGPDYVVKAQASSNGGDPNDTYYAEFQNSIFQKIHLQEAWNITTGDEDVVVGIIDSGIYGGHKDLCGRINLNLCRDFTGGEQDGVSMSVSLDPYGHGTKVAGIIGANGNNEKGVCGVCWEVTLVSLRVFDSAGNGLSSYIVNAISYAQSMEIPILNFSGVWCNQIGNSSTPDPSVEQKLREYEGLFVCAAGNGPNNGEQVNLNNDENPRYPANYAATFSNVISVGASNSADEKWYKSRYGKETVSIFAPGEDVYTTTNNGGYGSDSGTSLAAPFVAGVAALLLSKNSTLTGTQLKDIILDAFNVSIKTNDDDYWEGFCSSGGLLNAYLCLHEHDEENSEDISSDTVHRTYCSVCGLEMGIADHVFEVDQTATNTNEIHYLKCQDCGFRRQQGHDYSYVGTNKIATHVGICDICGYTYTERHTWVSYPTFLKCSKCGAKTTNVAIPGAYIWDFGEKSSYSSKQ